MALSLTTNKPLLMAMKAQIYDELSRKMGEREEGERERKVASDYELNFRYFNADAFEVFVKMYKLAFGSKSSMLRNNLTLCHCYFLKKPGLLRSFLSISHMREDVESGISIENLTEEYICSMKDVTRGLIKVLYLLYLFYSKRSMNTYCVLAFMTLLSDYSHGNVLSSVFIDLFSTFG
ncbi:uncharacterized protein LOC115950886 isoform X1 [Quercus lobata]|uniref:uncharacterized protein LOC115950886 isoform X1 n=1 Tax=Quercus lobata TaxID=97700 RepID=UPI0012462B68|nr:uncharacterized protein LOC115950886 isoform X1 [Quercus lobata]